MLQIILKNTLLFLSRFSAKLNHFFLSFKLQLISPSQGNDSFYVVHVWGTPYQMGVAEGTLLADQINQVIPSAMQSFVEAVEQSIDEYINAVELSYKIIPNLQNTSPYPFTPFTTLWGHVIPPHQYIRETNLGFGLVCCEVWADCWAGSYVIHCDSNNNIAQ
jgi:hypothetical protein